MTSKFALVIANTEYQDASFAKLTAPGMDAEEFAHVLREPELAAFDEVQVLLNEGESKIRRSIARFFVDRKRDDLLLLYFSGHGIRNDQGQLFLAANDTEISILEASGIPAEFVTSAMNNSRSQRQVLILDCCNSGAFAQGSKSASAVGKSMGIATAFEGSGFGRVVLTATDATQYAWEGDRVIGATQKSVFTHFLIEGLKGEADRDGDGRIHVDELYDYAYEQVVRRTPKQTPGKWSYKQQGDLVLRENLRPRDVKPVPLPSDVLYYLEHPSSGVRSTGVQELIRLLDGNHLGLARSAQDKLREIAENDDSLTLRRTANDTLIARGVVLKQPEPLSVEIPKEEPREEQKIEKPAQISLQPIQQGTVRETTPRTIPDWKSIAPKLNISTCSMHRLRLIGGIAGGLLIVGFLIWGTQRLLQNPPSASPEPTHIFQTTATFASSPSTLIASQPAKTSTPSPTRTATPSTQTAISPTPTLGIGSTMEGKDGMTLLYVPAGEFIMGNDFNGPSDEKPAHNVTLDAFWIDKTEVTNAMYATCVRDSKCEPPSGTSSYTRDTYFGNPEFDNYPVIYVTWNDAESYCVWAGRRLLTEAEWEKAASWDVDNQQKYVYPWGNDFDGTRVNFCDKNCSFGWADKSSYDGYADTAPVGNYPTGASPYGALDMAGNVWEWVSSLYKPYPYSATDGREDLSTFGVRVLRGGSWNYVDHDVRSALRNWSNPRVRTTYFGFRCAMSATP
jgi:formylglycine-generating enzyme required for sulfatase activity